jgi:hypothetical protein
MRLYPDSRSGSAKAIAAWVLIPALIALSLFLFFKSYGSKSRISSFSATKPPLPVGQASCEGTSLAFEVLSSWRIPKDKDGIWIGWDRDEDSTGVGMYILVPERSDKSIVLRLLDCIRDQYNKQGFLFLNIWDSKEAYLRQLDDTYPISKVWKHLLIVYYYNPANGYDEYNWMPYSVSDNDLNDNNTSGELDQS